MSPFLNIRHSRSALVSVLSAALSLALATAKAEPVGWIERFALADDRESALEELIPGSDDYYFYHCLHYQNVGQYERAETMLADWIEEKNGRQTPLIQNMLDRQRLLTYETSPQRTVEYLVRRLDVELRHAPPATKDQRRYASVLDETRLEVDRLVKEAVRSGAALKPAGIRHAAELFRRGPATGLDLSLRDLLGRVDGPYLDRLDELVIGELESRRPNDRRFGDVAAHSQLTLEELRRVADAVPDLSDDNNLVSAVLQRLRPDADSDPSQQPEVRHAYLERVESYVRTLPASYNSLKASAAFRLLESNVARGVFDRELFVHYLQLPRVSPIVSPSVVRGASQRADLGDDFTEMALLPPVREERKVVRAHLEHFLRDAENPHAFEAYLRPDYLNRVFAETKLMAGVGRAEQWYRMLTSAERQAIRDAVELRLSPQNRERFGSDEPVELLVDVKRVNELVVRVYEINTSAYYRTHDKRLDTDIDLDGLVATGERTLEYSQPAVIRHRERLRFPSIQGRGVWVIDLVGEGVRARAMVRRGSLHHVDSYSADGMVFTIVDEDRDPVPSATMLVGSREFAADDEGRIVLPPVAKPTRRRAILSDGALAVPVEFDHLVEKYSLTAGMHTDATLLHSGGKSEVLIRPRLALGTTPVDPTTLSQAAVTISATDLDDVTTTKKLDDVELDPTGELVVPFRVPRRLAKLRVSLTGVVARVSDGEQGSLRTSRAWDVAGIRRTNQTHDAFLTRDGDGFVIEVRGRSGEPVPGATVTVSLTSNVRTSTIDQTLQADDEGRLRLTGLDGISRIRFGVAGGIQHTRNLELDAADWPSKIHATSDRETKLPLAEPLESVSDRYRLLALRDGAVRDDETSELAAADGFLQLGPLAAGDYRLVDRLTGEVTNVDVVDGPILGSVATGRIRHRSVDGAPPLGIGTIRRTPDGLEIRLTGDTGPARVHVYAKRYLGPAAPHSRLAVPGPLLYGRRVSLPRCGYVSDLQLGDEYQYVLRRRYADKYPGVMLPQPSLILNPWETEETQNKSQRAAPGEAPSATARTNPPADMATQAATSEAEPDAGSSDYDFLADPGVQIANLRANDEGIVTVPADLIEGLPLVQLVVTGPLTTIQRTVTAELVDVDTRDLRLAQSLESDRALTFERTVSIASPESPLELSELGSAQLHVYATVGDLFGLYKTLVSDERFDDFEPLARWHRLKRSDKLAAYTRLASHELHLFLRTHDRPFFEDVVRPYLENKKEKQFVDHWLLESDLGRYRELWRYHGLNAAEKALLAAGSPAARDVVSREFREILEQQDDDHQRMRKIIESALAGSRLDATEPESLGERQAESGPATARALFGDFAVGNQSRAHGAGNAKISPALRQRSEAAARRLGQAEELRRKQDGTGGGMGGKAGMFFQRRSLGRSLAFYREIDATKQWAESQWDRVRTAGETALADLIPVDPFWAAVASAGPSDPTVSEHLLRPIGNRHAALAALAFCGLPLEADDVDLPADPDGKYAPGQPVAVVTKRLKSLRRTDDAAPVLVGQQFAEAASQADEAGADAALDEFLTGEAYVGTTVVSNPTPQRRTVEVFWQIPAGSVPLSGSHVTDSRTVELEPYAVQSIRYGFYFPSPGRFAHYPATVSSGSELLAQSQPREFRVVDQPSETDAKSWKSIARGGSAEQIREFLSTANLHQLDLMLVAHRMREPEVYRAVIGVLDEANMPAQELWAYGFEHRDAAAMNTYLTLRPDLVSRVGPVLDSPLLSVEPVQRRMIEHLEYAPLVRGRRHRLGDKHEILNPTFLAHYRDYVRVLAFGPTIDGEQDLALVYYLLLQNRVSEAVERFATINRDNVAARLQYDYLDGYLAMHREDYGRAEAIASRYAEHPIERWRVRFATMADQLRQARDLFETERLVTAETDDDREATPEDAGDLAVLDRQLQNEKVADEQPEVIVRVEGDRLRIDHRRTDRATVNLYGVDLELLFSKTPFVQDDLRKMAIVRPTKRVTLDFESATGVGYFPLDESLARQTLLVEVVAGSSRSTALHYGGQLTTYVSDGYGQLQATDSQTKRPVRAAYVKVYARYDNGNVRFYKDGYTDARGRFDYVSLSGSDAKGAKRFAILVLDDEKGATLHDVAAPTR